MEPAKLNLLSLNPDKDAVRSFPGYWLARDLFPIASFLLLSLASQSVFKFLTLFQLKIRFSHPEKTVTG